LSYGDSSSLTMTIENGMIGYTRSPSQVCQVPKVYRVASGLSITGTPWQQTRVRGRRARGTTEAAGSAEVAFENGPTWRRRLSAPQRVAGRRDFRCSGRAAARAESCSAARQRPRRRRR